MRRTRYGNPVHHGTTVEDYPEQVTTFREITSKQIEEVIDGLASHKTPGPDGIPNSIFKNCKGLLIPHLLPIYRATFRLKHYPESWKQSTTVVLRKPDRPDYTVPKAYRPIALLNVISKIL
ncbi:hypothetical protein BDV93DRAFT_459492, partial [Ceratobasidium sp. AG-I]